MIKNYKVLSKGIRCVFDTPCGMTVEFEIERAIKQGTIFGPALCCGNTSKISEIGENAMTDVSPTLSIDPLTYVDDIAAAGS